MREFDDWMAALKVPAYQLNSGRGAYDKRLRRVRHAKTGQWLAGLVNASETPQKTKDRA